MRSLKSAALVMVLLVNTLALLWMLSVRAVPAEGGRGAGDTAVGNGDVNCDGRIDLSDPVYMLSYLFQDGPELCAIAQEPPGECCQEQTDLLQRIAFALEQDCDDWRNRFTDNDDDTITDHCRGLMWKKSEGRFVRLDEAVSMAESSDLAGHTDWRLPTAEELVSLYRPDAQGLAIVPIFVGTSNECWTSTPYTTSAGNRWAVDFLSPRNQGLPLQERAGNDNAGTRLVRDIVRE